MISSLFDGPSGSARLKVSSLSDLVILHPNITNFSENDEILDEPTSVCLASPLRCNGLTRA